MVEFEGPFQVVDLDIGTQDGSGPFRMFSLEQSPNHIPWLDTTPP